MSKQRNLKRSSAAVGMVLAVAVAIAAHSRSGAAPSAAAGTPAPSAVATVPGMPPVVDSRNVYSETAAGKVRPELAGDLERVYVPNLRSNDVYVVDPQTLKVVDKFKVGPGPQHIVPSWDLRTLWVTNNAEGRNTGSLTPIDPRTGKPGTPIAVDDPYNMYATPDGKSAIVVAEARKRLDFRDPVTMALQYSIDVPGCPGVNHADFSIDGRYAIFTCEFTGALVKVDLVERRALGYLKLQMPATRFKETAAPRTPPGKVWEPGETEVCTATKGMPQDIRISPDGKRFYVADMHADGVHVIDGDAFKEIGFIPTSIGTHGLYPSRDGKKLYVVNRGSHKIHGPKRADGGVTVIDFATEKVVARWAVPDGGSPDMGNVSADGRWLWLAGRYDDVIYRFDTTSGEVAKVKVGAEPHGLTVWPLPGRYSLGHTGNLR
ncbi:YncE family protein [Ideonella sp.]|uniref:YncE family protein n=1 Tax=Ideonella sp. TaxID=1929293 RepID=UPI002B46407F|nr:YncE family protein [Ideonella sp.]HJV67511.1 YncE family protein [Ideonella sp.]